MPEWPAWWSWELFLSPHVLERMVERGFTEVDLRTMLENAHAYHPSPQAGRWTIDTRHDGADWRVVVEPFESLQLLAVVTAYPVRS